MNIPSFIITLFIVIVVVIAQIFTFGASLVYAQQYYYADAAQQTKKQDFYLSIKSTKPIPFYQKDSDKSAIIMQLPPNAVALEYVGCKDLKQAKNVYVKRTQGKRGWCQIIYRGEYGWVQKQFLQKYIVPEQQIFDCTHNVGVVDQFICDDIDLLKLAKQLNDIYNHSEQKAKIASTRQRDYLRELQNSQNSWSVSRQSCSNGDYYQKHDCLMQSYKIRITYLQTKWLLAQNAESIRYMCGRDNFIITKFLTELMPSVMVQNDKQREVMIDYVADIQTKYFGDNGLFLHENGDDVSLKWHNQRYNVACKRI